MDKTVLTPDELDKLTYRTLKDICMIKAIIYEQLENGKLFKEEE